MEQNKQSRKDQSLQKDQRQAGEQNVQQTSQQSGKDLNRGLGQNEQLQQTSTGKEQQQSDRGQLQSEDLNLGRENVGYNEEQDRDLEERAGNQERSNLPDSTPDSQNLDR